MKRWLKLFNASSVETPLLLKVREIGLRKNDPPGFHDNMIEKDIVFRGRVLIEVEDIWNDKRTISSRLDGEIYNRIAIYEKSLDDESKPFVAEQRRYNPGVILKTPEIFAIGLIPLMSLADEFEYFEDAVRWISEGPLVKEAKILEKFEKDLERHRAGTAPSVWPLKE